jgi:hypothetical protein
VQDELGLYYYPAPQNKKIRMYVRKNGNEIEFRMWDSSDATLWKDHGWVPWPAIQQAAVLYREEKKDGAPPLHLYDLAVAEKLIADAALTN